jgi:hypothetical protein
MSEQTDIALSASADASLNHIMATIECIRRGAPVAFGPKESGTEDDLVAIRCTTTPPIALSGSLTFTDASHICLEGFDVTGTVQITGGSGIHLKDLNISEAEIQISGGNRETLERSNHQITDCEILDSDIQVDGVGARILGNHIHGERSTIHLSGNEHLIEKNHIHNVGSTGQPSDAIRIGGDWTERGNIIRHNRFHDITGWAIRFDDLSSGTVTQGNVFYDTAGILVGGGRNHRITNNIFVDCTPAINVDARGMSETDDAKQLLSKMHASFDARNPLDPPYAIRYPELKEVAAYYFHELGVPPEGNLINRNICLGTWIDVDEPNTRKMLALQNNFLDDDPGFADLTSRNLHLPENAEVYELGFKPIPLDDIGKTQNQD